jgi:hypothetical protein
MDVIKEIGGLLEEWRKFSGQERLAIKQGDWAGLSQVHQFKSRLQTKLEELCSGLEHSDLNLQLGHVAEQLIESERENFGLLAQRKHVAHEGLLETSGSLRKLRQLRRYCGQPSNENWISFS